MTIIDLATRRRTPATCDCPRHQLDALAGRIRRLLNDTEEQLLIPRDHLAQALDDLTATTARLLPPPPSERSR